MFGKAYRRQPDGMTQAKYISEEEYLTRLYAPRDAHVRARNEHLADQREREIEIEALTKMALRGGMEGRIAEDQLATYGVRL